MAPYLLAKKLVLEAIGRKQVKMIPNIKANDSHNFLIKYILRDENAKDKTIK